MFLKPLWKPIVHRAVSGRWRRFHMRPMEPPQPEGLSQAGLYLHVPFCRSLCPFCPYNRVEYDERAFARYERAVLQEVDLYAPSLRNSQITSLYVGGGTPTVNPAGLVRILEAFRGAFHLDGDVCVELHPACMDEECLAALRRAGVTMASIGVESTSDRLLRKIGRSHNGAEALNAVERAVAAGFDSVNVDLMFALPGQTLEEWETDLKRVLEVGIDQLSTYPLFSFPYSELGRTQGLRAVQRPNGKLIRRMLALTNELARAHGLQRCAVWSWLRARKKKFSSITRHYYVGFGPSAASMTRTHFYVNTFDVEAYAARLPERRPIALAMPIDERLEMAYWLYWRVYELEATEKGFQTLFGPGASLSRAFGRLLKPCEFLGLAERRNGGYRITESGAYWIHRLQNEYSLNYINRLWGACRRLAWPKEAIL